MTGPTDTRTGRDRSAGGRSAEGAPPALTRGIGATVGAAAFLAGGLAAGGWWWSVAVVGVVATLAGLAARRAGLAQAVATLALAAGVVGAGRDAVVVVLVAGVVVSLEFAAAADRVTRVRPRAPWPPARRVVGALATAPLVLWVGAWPFGPAVPLTLLATAGAGALVVLATRP